MRLLLCTKNTQLGNLVQEILAQFQGGVELVIAPHLQQAWQDLTNGSCDIYIFDTADLGASVATLIAENENPVASLIIVDAQNGEPIHPLPINMDVIPGKDLSHSLLVRALRYAQQVQRTRILDSRYRHTYRTLINHNDAGVFVVDPQRKIVLANQALYDLLGYTTPLEGMPVRDLIVGVPATGMLARPDENQAIEAQLRHQDGHRLRIVLHSHVLPNRNIQFVVRDIAGRSVLLEERDEYVRRLRALHEMDEELSQQLNSDYVINMSLDAAMRLGQADAGYLGRVEEEGILLDAVVGAHKGWSVGEVLAYTPEVQTVVDNYRPMLIPSEAGQQAKMLLPLIASDRVIGVLYLETPHAARFTEETFNFLTLIASRVAIAIENANLYRLAQERLVELRHLYDQVSSLEKLKTDMIRIASHDLRNPVSVILTHTALLRRVLKDTLTEQQSHYLQTITDSARRMTEITQNFLSLEQIEANLYDQEPQLVNLTYLVEQIVLQFKGQMSVKSLANDLLLPDHNVHVRGDSAQLREAIANLMSNAIKYTPANGQVIAHLQDLGSEALFTVQDTGYGIAIEEQDRLFRPFQRIYNPATADIPGTGLGLYLIKNIIERHHGDIVVESTPGEGSTFGFSLPTVSAVL